VTDQQDNQGVLEQQRLGFSGLSDGSNIKSSFSIRIFPFVTIQL
jgi:hypothetical protein